MVGDTLVGFIGVGSIGRPMAERLIDAGFKLAVYDVNVAAMNYFSDRALCATSPKHLGDLASVVLSCLPTLDATREAILGSDGLIHGEKLSLHIHTGTVGAPLIQELGSQLNSRSVEVVDAPITGGVPRARAGQLTAIVSGPDQAVTRARQYLEPFASKVVKVGSRVGDAQRVKLINNYLSAANLAIACEAIVLARKAELDLDVVLEVINHGSGQNSATLHKLPQYVVPRQFNRGGALGLMYKDLQEAAAEAQRQMVPMPLGDAVLSTFERALAEGAPTDDVTSIVKHMERAAGLYLDADPSPSHS